MSMASEILTVFSGSDRSGKDFCDLIKAEVARLVLDLPIDQRMQLVAEGQREAMKILLAAQSEGRQVEPEELLLPVGAGAWTLALAEPELERARYFSPDEFESSKAGWELLLSQHPELRVAFGGTGEDSAAGDDKSNAPTE